MMNAVGGEHWWNHRKTRLVFNREAAVKREKARKRRAKREAENYRQTQIRRHMGAFKYYCMPWERARFNAIYPTADAPGSDGFDDDDDDDDDVPRNDDQKRPDILGRSGVSPPPWDP